MTSLKCRSRFRYAAEGQTKGCGVTNNSQNIQRKMLRRGLLLQEPEDRGVGLEA
jgi:hypothetical protein